MFKHKVFKIDEGETIIVFIPSLFEVYRLKKSDMDKIANYVVSEKPQPISRWDGLPDYCFLGTNLILTNHCNLCCAYCYAGCSPKGEIWMSIKIAKAAINHIAECAKKVKCDKIYVNMFGGEPTQAWNVMVESYKLLRIKAAELGVYGRCTITTNGCITPTKAEWLANHMDNITISFDGPKAIQNAQRDGSFNVVFKRAQQIYAISPKKLAFRITISDHSVNLFPQIVDFIGSNFPGCMQLHEPLFTIGRGKNSLCTMPDHQKFFDQFIDALPIAEKHGVKLKTSVLNLGAKSPAFCGVAAKNFMITPDGKCTTCNRMADESDETCKRFIYGHYDPNLGQFVFDNGRYQWLKRIGSHSIPQCQDCFAQSSCRSDCAANKATIDPNGFWQEKVIDANKFAIL